MKPVQLEQRFLEFIDERLALWEPLYTCNILTMILQDKERNLIATYKNWLRSSRYFEAEIFARVFVTISASNRVDKIAMFFEFVNQLPTDNNGEIIYE